MSDNLVKPKKTAAAPATTAKQHVLLHAKAAEPGAAPAVMPAAGAMVHIGNTAHFSVNADSTLGANGRTLANGVLATCEQDYDNVQHFFPLHPNNAFLLQTGTPITQADAANFLFATGDFNKDGIPDLFCVKRSNTGTGKLEVHILNGATNYQSFLLQTGTPITQADAPNFVFAAGNFNADGIPDLYCLKLTNTGSGKLEVHILSGASNYQSFLLQTATPITAADAANFQFTTGDFNKDGIADLFCLKRSNTGTGKLEVHVLSGASKYQAFLLQTGTPITQADAANFLFATGDFNRDGSPDLFCMKRTNTGTAKLEVHVLSGAANYQSFLLQTATPISQADAANFLFATGDFNKDGIPDLFCLKRTNTGTQSLEVHILSGKAGYLGGLRFVVNIQPGSNGASHSTCADTTLNCDAFGGTDQNLERMLVVAEADEVFMDTQNNGWDCGASNGEGLSRLISAELYPGSQSGFETGPSWLASNRPNFVDNTDGTDRNFVSIGCATLFLNYLHYQLGHPWLNIIGAGGNPLAKAYTRTTGIQGGGFLPFSTLLQQFFPAGRPVTLGTDNPFPLSPFALQTGTPITQADAANFLFATGDFNRDGIPDLFCLKHSNTGSGKLEIHILGGASNYQSFLLQTPTPIAVADAANFVFATGDFNRDGVPDLYCLKHTNTGSNSLEVHILGGAGNYQSFLLQTGTPVTQADAGNFLFATGDFNGDGTPDLYCLKHANTGTNKLEVHILGGKTNYQGFLLQAGTPITQADAANFQFATGDYNRDGIPDLYCLKRNNTGTNKLEVHILNGAGSYQSFLLQTATPITQADAANFLFSAGDFNRDGLPDLYCLKRTNTGTGKLEVHVLNGGAGY